MIAPLQEARTAAITVALVKNGSVPSRLIEWFGGGGWSHFVAMLLPGGKEVIDARNDQIGRVPPGVQIRPVDYLRGSACLWLEVPCTPAQAAASEANLRAVVAKGTPYDQIGILDFALGRSTDHSWMKESAFFCSDLGVWNFWKVALLGDPLIPPTRVDPGEALAVCWGLQARRVQAPWERQTR